MQSILFFYPEKQSPPRKGNFYLNGVKLAPGRNKYEEKAFQALKTHPAFKPLTAKGIIDIIAQNLPEAEEEIIMKNLTVKEAEKVIVVEKDIKQLEKWRDEETKVKGRETILNAIARQIKTIQEGEL